MKTNSKLKLAFLSTLMIAGANAHAGAGDVAVEASTAIIQSLASKAVTEAFFPSGIDYGRMRAEMEAATRVVMTEAFVSQAEGWIKQGNREALSIVKLSSVSPTRKYDELDRLRYSIARRWSKRSCLNACSPMCGRSPWSKAASTLMSPMHAMCRSEAASFKCRIPTIRMAQNTISSITSLDRPFSSSHEQNGAKCNATTTAEAFVLRPFPISTRRLAG